MKYLVVGIVLLLLAVTITPPEVVKPIVQEEPKKEVKKIEKHSGKKVSSIKQKVVKKEPILSQKTKSAYCPEYQHLVEQYDWDVDTMLYAMFKESSCIPTEVGDTYVIAGVYAPSCGLLQVRTLPGRPDCESLKNPSFNVATAYKIWLSQGYKAWSVLH